MFLILLEYTVPIVPILVSCVITVMVLARSRPMTVTRTNSDPDANKKRATVTVVLFTLLYVVCNVPFTVYEILTTLDLYKTEWELLEFDEHGQYFTNFITIHSVALNSTGNFFLYLWRIRALREYLSQGFRNFRVVTQHNIVTGVSHFRSTMRT